MKALPRWLLVLALLLSAACEDFSRPAEPVWDKQPCAHCRMLVSDPRYAGQLVNRNHERLYFDDPGCLAAYVHSHAAELERAWVHSVSGWVPAERARFSAGQPSPMGYDFLPDPNGEHDFAAVTRAAATRHDRGAP